MNCKGAVAIRGARMNYAVPRILDRADCLQQLYTDGYLGTDFWYQILSKVPNRFLPNIIARLKSRKIDIPASKITGFGFDEILYKWRLQQTDNVNTILDLHCEASERFNRKVCRLLSDEISFIYGINGDALGIFTKAKRNNISCILEQTIAPYRLQHAIITKEQQIWADWSIENALPDVDKASKREEEEWQIADTVIGASDFVIENLISLGVAKEKCQVVPYGVQVDSFNGSVRKKTHSPLRVFFAGGIGLRKGIPYLLQAAKTLGTSCEFRLAGAVNCNHDVLIENMPSNTKLLGIIPRNEMAQHFEWADIFCFPTLLEGSATVIYEALASGLPIITTPNAGSVVSDGEEGYIIPAHDFEAIVEKVEVFIENEEVIHPMSLKALQTANDFSVEKYGERLLAILVDVMNDYKNYE